MLNLKDTAIPKHLTPQAVLLLMIAKDIHAELGLDLTVTSLNDSTHHEGSYHYSGNAFDSRIRGANWTSLKYPDADQCMTIVQMAAARLNKCFDVVIECDHIHWEYNARKFET